MAKRKQVENRNNGAGRNGADTPRLPTIEELKRAYEEGLPQTLLSGLEVQMRPVQLDKLLMEGKVPDTLTPLVIRMMFGAKPDDVEFPDEIDDPVTHYLTKKREEADNAVEYLKSIDLICRESLVDPSILPYLSLTDRMWVFKMALLPAQVLSNFRHEPQGDVAGVDESDKVQQAAERDNRPAQRDRRPDKVAA